MYTVQFVWRQSKIMNPSGLWAAIIYIMLAVLIAGFKTCTTFVQCAVVAFSQLLHSIRRGRYSRSAMLIKLILIHLSSSTLHEIWIPWSHMTEMKISALYRIMHWETNASMEDIDRSGLKQDCKRPMMAKWTRRLADWSLLPALSQNPGACLEVEGIRRAWSKTLSAHDHATQQSSHPRIWTSLNQHRRKSYPGAKIQVTLAFPGNRIFLI